MKKKEKDTKGRISIGQMRELLNKKAGAVVAYSLEETNQIGRAHV